MSSDSLSELFWQHFYPTLAKRPEDRFAIHRIRYEVYCREFGYEKEEDCPGGLEVDAYDPWALHCLVRHRETGTPAGCVRLVLPAPPRQADPLPFERFGGHSIENEELHPRSMPRHEVAEVSRLAVVARFRKRADESRTPIGNTDPLPDSRHFPIIAIALSVASAALVGLSGRRYSYAMMEPRLARLLARSGLNFTRIGQLTDYHGFRAPYALSLEKALRELRPELRTLYGEIRDHFEPNLPEQLSGLGRPTAGLIRPEKPANLPRSMGMVS